MSRHDVVVVGAGLAGLACAYDLFRAGTDVLVVEARDRVGGRVEQQHLPDGRVVELGGELAGELHRHYRRLAAELGLELVPSYVAEPGEAAYDLVDGVALGETWLDERDLESMRRVTAELERLADELDPADRGLGGFWPQDGNTLSSLFGPEQLAYLDALTEERQTELVLEALARLVGPVEPVAVLWWHWGREPYTLGYASHWAPGDLTAVGPLHGTHEPPFFVAGSDHWAAGYMEGAVATGRGAAASLLGTEADVYS